MENNKKIIDFHCHNYYNDSRISLISLELEQFLSRKIKENLFYSLSLHPWFLPAEYIPLNQQWQEQGKNADAIGEIGLDKVKGVDFNIQQKYFAEALKLAVENRKPIVIHCVRAYQEIFSQLDRYKNISVLFHGFKGKASRLEECLKRGYFVSMQPKIMQENNITELIKRYPQQVGRESDDNINTSFPPQKDISEEQFKENLFAFLKKD